MRRGVAFSGALLVLVLLLLTSCGRFGSEGEGDDEVVVGDVTETTAEPGTTSSSTTPPTTAATPSASPTRDPNQRYRATATILESPSHGPQLCLGSIADSYPPQCGGPDVVGWSWDAVDGEESASGTTWASATVIGTYAGRQFTLTEPPRPPEPPTPRHEPDFSPACDEPEGDPSANRESFRQPDDPDVAAVWVSGPETGTATDVVFSVVVRPGAADRVRTLVRRHWDGLLCVVERDQPSRRELEALQGRVDAESAEAPMGGFFYSYTDESRGVVVVGCGIADDVATAWALEHWGDDVVLEGQLEPVD